MRLARAVLAARPGGNLGRPKGWASDRTAGAAGPAFTNPKRPAPGLGIHLAFRGPMFPQGLGLIQDIPGFSPSRPGKDVLAARPG